MVIDVLEVIRKRRLMVGKRKEDKINDKMQIELCCTYFTLHSSEIKEK